MIEAAVLGKDQDLSLGHYLQEWLAHARGRVRATTYQGYESLIRCYGFVALAVEAPNRGDSRHEIAPAPSPLSSPALGLRWVPVPA